MLHIIPPPFAVQNLDQTTSPPQSMAAKVELAAKKGGGTRAAKGGGGGRFNSCPAGFCYLFKIYRPLFSSPSSCLCYTTGNPSWQRGKEDGRREDGRFMLPL